MGKILGVQYYNEENGLLVLKWIPSEGDECSSEDYKYFIATYIKDTKLTCLLDDSGEMIRYRFYDEGKKVIEPVLSLPEGDENCISKMARRVICMGLHATHETFDYNPCEHSFGILKIVCEVLVKNGIVPKDIREYFDILNSFDYRFISESKLPEEKKQEVLSIMASFPNESKLFLDKAMAEQEDLRGVKNYDRTQLPYFYYKK